MNPDPSSISETLSGRTALVTGGSKGVGAAVVARLAAAGAFVMAINESEFVIDGGTVPTV